MTQEPIIYRKTLGTARYRVLFPNGTSSEIDPYFVDKYCPNKEDMRTPFTGYRIVAINENEEDYCQGAN
jgi:hypothetical protein